jgi:hypothetical protein
MDAGLPLKGERANPSTWRYSFYDKGCAPEGGQRAVDCLGCPISVLPPNVQVAFSDLFGPLFGSFVSSEQLDSVPNREKEGDIS